MSPKFKKIARTIFITLNIITLFFYLLACLVPFLNAGKFPYVALSGLVFPMLFVAVLCFLVYWLIRRSKWAWVCVAALLLGWQQITTVFRFGSTANFKTEKSPRTLRVLTWNISSWGETNRNSKTNNQDNMVALIKSSGADVLCFQEFVWYKNFKYRDTIIAALKEAGYQYTYFERARFSGRLYTTTILIGIEIVSKYPITNAAKFFYPDDDITEPLIYADIAIDTQTIRIFTTHLQSVKFIDNDYEALHNLKEPVTASIQQTRSVAGKLKHAYKGRALQAEALQEKIKESPYPVIVCGDFNDVPSSYTYFTVTKNLQDAFLKKGSGFGRTFRFISPTLRIDYILADKKFDVLQYNVFKVPYSDHYPVVADFDITEKK